MPERETSRLVATSRSVKPSCWARSTIHFDVDRRRVEYLLEADVDGPGNGRDAPHEVAGDLLVLRVAPDDLHVDRRRQSEVQDLPDDVGGLEEEHQFREPFAQDRAQAGDVLQGRAVALRIEGDENLPVGRRDDRRVAERQVHSAPRDTDVVDDHLDLVGRDGLADHRFDLGVARFRLLDAGSGGRADVQAELSGVDRGEEVHTQQREQGERGEREPHECADDEPPVVQPPVERAGIGGLEPLEAAVEALVKGPEPAARGGRMPRLMEVGLGGEQVVHHRGHHGAREEVAGEHREHDGERERHEEIPGDAANEDDRHEDDADAQRRDERGRGDLLCAVENGAGDRLPHGEVAVRVLDLDGRVVHQDADGERQPARASSC